MALLGPKRAASRKNTARLLPIAGALSAASCFVTIADPARDAVTGSGGAGGTHADGGGPAGEGGKTGAMPLSCDGGNKICGGRCVRTDDPTFGCKADTCAPCALDNNTASQVCNAGACAIGLCKPDWVDCDGKPENGCEVDFGNPLAAPDGGRSPALASHLTLSLSLKIDGDPKDWAGVPRYAMREPCTECDPKQPGGQTGQPIIGASFDDKDFRSEFRVAWDSSALYVLVQVEDSEIAALDVTDAEKQDGIELFLDGLNEGSRGYDPNDHHLFIGAPGNVVKEVNRPLPSVNDVRVMVGLQASCYFVEARLTWFYIMAATHTPKGGDISGFTIAANDWDRPSGDAKAAPERQDQLFWVDPKQSYTFDTGSFGNLQLEP